jgi:hypothetical protein
MKQAPFMNKTMYLLGTAIAIAVFMITPVLAEDLDSGNYKLKDVTFSGNEGGGSSSANYAAYVTTDEYIHDVRFTSANYQIRAGVLNTWKANVPKVQCFETTSAGSTNCQDGDISNGMVALCGQSGCYDRARVEIDPQSNPSDTLYSLQITTDSNWTTWNYVDGSTFMVESAATHNLSDYLTESAWENVVANYNVYGLQPGTTYYVRFTAIHGDFTESEPGPALTATTSTPQVTFDIDIANSGGSATETAAPYSINIGTLRFGSITTSTNLIWIDIGTNVPEGAGVYVRSQYGGLFTSSGSYTINSVTGDLSSTTGYGLQGNTTTQTYLGPLNTEAIYAAGGENIGILTTNIYGTRILNTNNQPIYNGRASFYLKARPPEQAPATTDYVDSIIFTVGGNL